MKISLILTLVMLVLLGGCSLRIPTEAERYNIAVSGCTMSGYIVTTHSKYYDGKYICVSEHEVRSNKFSSCSRMCDDAIDDNRDLTLQNSTTEVLGCLKLCMGE